MVSAVRSNLKVDDDVTDEALQDSVLKAVAAWLPTVNISKTSEYSSRKLGSAIVDYFASLKSADDAGSVDAAEPDARESDPDPIKIIASNAIANSILKTGLAMAPTISLLFKALNKSPKASKSDP